MWRCFRLASAHDPESALGQRTMQLSRYNFGSPARVLFRLRHHEAVEE